MPTVRQLRDESARVTKLIRDTPFESCFPLVKGFTNLSEEMGIYGIRSMNEVLYIGKASAFRTRFRGHQALVSMFIDGIAPDEIRIVLVPISGYYEPYLLLLEKQATFALQPRYNGDKPTVDQITKLMQLRAALPPNKLAELLDFMPDPVIEGIEAFAESHGMSAAQVIELALSSFLRIDATSFAEIEQSPSPGQLKEELAIAQLQLAAVRQALSKAGIPDPSQLPELPE
jgi:hypothetical protein